MRKWRLRARASLFRAAWIFAAVFYSYTCRSRTTDRKRHAQRRIASYFMRGTWGQALYTNTLAGWLVMLPSYQATPAKKGKNGTEEERAAKTGKGGAEKSDRLISLTTRPRKGQYTVGDEPRRVHTASRSCSFEVNELVDYAKSAGASRLNIQLNGRMKFIRDRHRTIGLWNRAYRATCSISGRKSLNFVLFD